MRNQWPESSLLSYRTSTLFSECGDRRELHAAAQAQMTAAQRAGSDASLLSYVFLMRDMAALYWQGADRGVQRGPP
jgi:hypothetical protein